MPRKGKPPKKRSEAIDEKKEKNHRNSISRGGRTGIGEPQGIIDSGTEIDDIGGPAGCNVISTIGNMSAQLDGTLAGMGARALRLVHVRSLHTVTR